MEVIQTKRGGPCLVINNYRFRIDRSCKKTISWRCCERGCNARCTTDQAMETLIAMTDAHNHDPCDPVSIDVDRVRAAVKRKVIEDPTTSAAQIVNSEVVQRPGISQQSLESLTTVAKRARRKQKLKEAEFYENVKTKDVVLGTFPDETSVTQNIEQAIATNTRVLNANGSSTMLESIPLEVLENLASVIHLHPCLYDPRFCSNSETPALQEMAWIQITNTMSFHGLTEVACKQHWYHLLTQYMTRKKRQLLKSQTSDHKDDPLITWELYPSMKFLEGFMDNNNDVSMSLNKKKSQSNHEVKQEIQDDGDVTDRDDNNSNTCEGDNSQSQSHSEDVVKDYNLDSDTSVEEERPTERLSSSMSDQASSSALTVTTTSSISKLSFNPSLDSKAKSDESPLLDGIVNHDGSAVPFWSVKPDGTFDPDWTVNLKRALSNHSLLSNEMTSLPFSVSFPHGSVSIPDDNASFSENKVFSSGYKVFSSPSQVFTQGNKVFFPQGIGCPIPHRNIVNEPAHHGKVPRHGDKVSKESSKPKTSDQLFCDSLVPRLQALPNDIKSYVLLQISQVFFNAENRNNQVPITPLPDIDVPASTMQLAPSISPKVMQLPPPSPSPPNS